VRPQLVYFDQWTDPVAGEILAEHGDIDVARLEITGDVDANWSSLERAHGYQSLIRTELARRPGVAEQWICGAELLARCPDLLAVCSAGAGYDIIDVEACTAAGVIV
jgi:D-3-phosphoglycerate dehydrogenase